MNFYNIPVASGRAFLTCHLNLEFIWKKLSKKSRKTKTWTADLSLMRQELYHCTTDAAMLFNCQFWYLKNKLAWKKFLKFWGHQGLIRGPPRLQADTLPLHHRCCYGFSASKLILECQTSQNVSVAHEINVKFSEKSNEIGFKSIRDTV